MRTAWIGLFLLSMAGYAAAAERIQLTLDWKPEPEFGGFYAAQQNGTFAKHGLDVTIKSAGEGAPTWQLVATGKTQFARRGVALGVSQNGKTQILTGLQANDHVVGDGSLFLQFQNSLQR